MYICQEACQQSNTAIQCLYQAQNKKWKPGSNGWWTSRRCRKWSVHVANQTLVRVCSLPLEQHIRTREIHRRHAINTVNWPWYFQKSKSQHICSKWPFWRESAQRKEQRLLQYRVTLAFLEGASMGWFCFKGGAHEQMAHVSREQAWIVKESPGFLEISPGLCWVYSYCYQNGDNATQSVVCLRIGNNASLCIGHGTK